MAKQPQKKHPKKRALRVLLTAAALLFAALLSGVVLAGCNAAASAPDVTKLEWNTSTTLYDRNGKEIYNFYSGENRKPVKLSEIPKPIVEAFIAIEDPNFYNHHGIDPRGLARAAFRSTLYYLHLPGGHLEGGSTITQELARDGWLTQEVTFKRKLQEAWVAIQLERKYTKDEILEMYLNQIYFGHGAAGIQTAAQTFFGKDVGQLTVAEGAQLAGMINGPTIFDPYQHPKDSITRRNLVLSAMVKEDYLTEAQAAAAKATQPKLADSEKADAANHAIDYAINILSKPELAAKYGIKLGDVGPIAKAGLKVYTTLDANLQQLAMDAVAQQMAQADKDYGIPAKGPKPEAAMVAMDPKTGEILAMVGGREHTTMLAFNRATDAFRQPGSSIKPLVDYTPALAKGLSPATILDDAPVMLTADGKTVWPQNYDFKYEGLKPMRYGVEQSINPMAVRALIAAGGPSVGIDYAHKYGLTTIGKDDNNLALALGGITNGTTVLDMAAAYSAIDNMGTKVDPFIITKIVDRSGQTVFEAHPQKHQVIEQGVAYEMIDMMKDVIKRGTAYGFTRGFKGWPAAGKTGTTENNRDGWFIGMTPNVVTAVWNGYDEASKYTLPYTGAFVPVKIWNQFMTSAVPQRPADWPRPSDVVNVQVCRLTGMLPNDLCPKDQIVSDIFLRGHEPTTAGDILVKAQAVQVTTQTADKKHTLTQWQLWQPGCLGAPVERVFIKRPQPRVLHPTDPFNPKYVPQDAQNELPTATCQPVSWWERLIPQLPFPVPPGTPQQPGVQPPGQQPPTQQPPAQQPPGTGTPGLPGSGPGNNQPPSNGDGTQLPPGGGAGLQPVPPPSFND